MKIVETKLMFALVLLAPAAAVAQSDPGALAVAAIEAVAEQAASSCQAAAAGADCASKVASVQAKVDTIATKPANAAAADADTTVVQNTLAANPGTVANDEAKANKILAAGSAVSNKLLAPSLLGQATGIEGQVGTALTGAEGLVNQLAAKGSK